jgi:hypothetical protein
LVELVSKKVSNRFGNLGKGSIFAAAKQERSYAGREAEVHYNAGLQGIKKKF